MHFAKQRRFILFSARHIDPLGSRTVFHLDGSDPVDPRYDSGLTSAAFVALGLLANRRFGCDKRKKRRSNVKGIIFNELEAMLRSAHGDDAWEDILDSTELQTEGGVFVGPKVYPDADFFLLVSRASAITSTPVDALATAFGRYLLPRLISRYPMFVQPGMAAKDFLKTVHDTIHVEVRKLHPDAALPTFEYEDPGPDRLVMKYTSSRKACDLAVGLIEGVAESFGQTITLNHVRCTKRGDEHCRFDLQFGERT